MLPHWYYAIAFITAMLVVVFSIPWVKAIALRNGQVDLPSHRKVHQRPMVRLGGISICAGTLIALILIWSFGGFTLLPTAVSNKIFWLMLGGFGFFLIGLLDDLFTLPPLTRLLMQGLIAGLVWAAGVRIEFVTVPSVGIVHLGVWSLPLTVFWLTGVVNAINWMDGLDGLASGVSGIAAVMIFVVCLSMGQPGAALVALTLAGSLLGFLYYNFNPARIFMGDGGSYFIGFVIAGVSILGLVKVAVATAILLPLLILAVPLLDMSAVILVRLWHRKSPFVADKRHLHHRLLQAGLSHRRTVYVIYGLAFWVGSLAIASIGIAHGFTIFASATGLLGCTTWQAWKSIR
jgi:UDP-GlcNAc:undecaprenyl-phosphate/decaprenyl-phosphate GlcNAc-1-phosphate transferase